MLDDGGEGQLAATLFLGTGRAEGALAIDHVATRRCSSSPTRRTRSISRSRRCRLKKDAMDEAQYDAQLEKLLTDLALKTKAIRDLQAKKDKP